MVIQSGSLSAPRTSALSKTTNKSSFKQQATQLVAKADQTLKPLAQHATTPREQEKALTETKKVLKEATTLVQSNPDTSMAAKQTEALAELAQQTKQVKTTLDNALVIKARTRDEAAVKAYKKELAQKMIQGLASAMPEVRQNARRALSNLGVTEEQLDQLRLALEHEKKQQSSVKFGSYFPFKMSGPNGIRFKGKEGTSITTEQGRNPGTYATTEHGRTYRTDAIELNDCKEFILDSIVEQNSLDSIANQAVNYHVSNVTDHLTPILFGASQDLQLKNGTIINIPIGATRPSDATVIRTWL